VHCPLTAVIARFRIDRGDYAVHAWSTVRVAVIGFVMGNTVAVLVAVAFIRLPTAERLTPCWSSPCPANGPPPDVAHRKKLRETTFANGVVGGSRVILACPWHFQTCQA